MSNVIVTNNKVNSLVVWEPVFSDELITFTGAATLLPGTILARDTATLKLVPFEKGGTTNGNGIPNSVLLNELTATGAGDLPERPIIEGRLRAALLVIDADGDASNVDATVLDQLRTYGIIGQDVAQLDKFDNQ